MAQIQFESDAFRVAAELKAIGVGAQLRAARVTRHWGQLLQTQVKANASGRPGPKAIKGNYRRSISFRFALEGGNPVAIVGTSYPQGRRLEMGFYDMTDSLGRHFFQPPYPHFEPAIKKIAPRFHRAIADIAVVRPA